ncbi:MAG: tRNA(Ile)(2)-agmatinylcytidine synthase [Candidatus Hadarchaeales archaeon]
MFLHVGIDDTDSPRGMCTTYVGAVAIERAQKLGAELVDYPRLIRLNPCWPEKTRGNCAVAFLLKLGEDLLDKIKKAILKTVEELAEEDEKTNPGVVFYPKRKIPPELSDFALRVVRDIVTIDEARELARLICAEIYEFRKGKGIIGALAAIGHPLDRDFTFEYIAYRIPQNYGKPRKVDPESVREMNEKTFPLTFDNIDPWTGEIKITPHTPCPILYGIRGESPEILEKAAEIVKVGEPIERTIIYKTNQATDEHLIPAKIKEIKPLRSYSVRGFVSSKPRVIPGGHVIFTINDDTGKIHCAAYEPTRKFREIVLQLMPGDEIVVHGSVKEKPGIPLTLNLEKIEVLKLAEKIIKVNPTCPICGRRTKSMGRGKGYECEKCKYKFPPEAVEYRKKPRIILPGKFEVPPRARRHLSKPLVREFRSKIGELTLLKCEDEK